MNTRTRLSLVAVAVAMVTGVLVGTVTGSGEAGAATQRTLRIPASAFRPVDDNSGFWNDGFSLSSSGSTGSVFTAPVILEGNTATIHSVKLHYFDNGPKTVCVELDRSNLKAGSGKYMSQICTKGADPAARTRIDAAIKPDTVGPTNATYLYATVPSGNYGLFGVTIVYTSDL